MYVCYFFFFFQAEDGIRDGTVTGVQTCALPIYANKVSRVPCSPGDFICVGFSAGRAVPERAVSRPGRRGNGQARSEERRVGKECRSRWVPYDERKKIGGYDFSERGHSNH